MRYVSTQQLYSQYYPNKNFHNCDKLKIINYYVSKYENCSYLEIGVQNANNNLNLVKVNDKDGVDPNVDCKYKMTSDDFFKQSTKKYDVIFIDGCHERSQVYKDVINSLVSLKENGIIIMHDINPPIKLYECGNYCGDGWRAFVELRRTRNDLNMFVVDTDFGVGVIEPNKSQKVFECSDDIYIYENFDKQRIEAINLISVEQWEILTNQF